MDRRESRKTFRCRIYLAKLRSPDSVLVKISVKFPLTAMVQVQSFSEENSPTRPLRAG